MRNKVLPIIVLFVTVFFYACEEDFNLKSDYKPRYSLNCILRADTTVHFVTITKSYMVDGFDPYAYTEDPFLSGADIRLWEKDSVYFFNDTILTRTDTSRFNFPQRAYFIRDYRPGENDFLEIKAILDNGKTLHAYTRVPRKIKWDSTSTFVIPVAGSDEYNIAWQKNNNIGQFLLRLQLRYKKDGPESPIQAVPVPMRFNGDKPVYPSATKNTSIPFELAALRKLMDQISEGQPDKSKIIIYGITVELLVFDDNLSKYYSNLNGYMDDFTVRVDQNDFSNVEGGFGIFGSYIKQVAGVLISESYIRSLGYGVPN